MYIQFTNAFTTTVSLLASHNVILLRGVENHQVVTEFNSDETSKKFESINFVEEETVLCTLKNLERELWIGYWREMCNV